MKAERIVTGVLIVAAISASAYHYANGKLESAAMTAIFGFIVIPLVAIIQNKLSK